MLLCTEISFVILFHFLILRNLESNPGAFLKLTLYNHCDMACMREIEAFGMLIS